MDKIICSFLRILIKIYRRMENIYVRDICTVASRAYVRAMGMHLGKDVIFFSMPFCSITPGSRVSIGNNCTIRSHYKGNAIGVNHKVIIRTISKDALIDIGNNVGMSGVSICAYTNIVIGNYVTIGSNVVIADNDMHPVNPSRRQDKLGLDQYDVKGVTIKDNAWIGASCYILKGVTVGENSVIGAGSVVTRDIPDNCIAGGVPAKIVKYLV